MRNDTAAVLREVTERLAQELAVPSARVPHWSQEHWIVARAVAAMHGVGPLLARRLYWRGPAEWCAFLEQQFEATRVRHARIAALQKALDRAACSAGFAAIALKGAALHALRVYQPGERPMADFDVLVQPHDAPAAMRAIESLGYRELYVSWKERVYAPVLSHDPQALGEGACNDVKIELHERICEKLPFHITDVTSRLWPGAATAPAGVRHYTDDTRLMLHLLLHAAGSIAFQALRLLHLVDLAAVAQRLSLQQWRDLLSSAPAALWWAHPPLSLTARYFPGSIPESVLRQSTRQCPSGLRRAIEAKLLTDVSFSYPWVDALPGGDWCRSAVERVRYAGQRVYPGREQRALRAAGSDTQAWAQVNEWNSMRQGRRLMCWLLRRQARPVTLHALNASRTLAVG